MAFHQGHQCHNMLPYLLFPFFRPRAEGPVGISSVCICESLHLIGPVITITLFPRCFLQLVFKMGKLVFPLYRVWNKGFPGSSEGKESACSVGDPGLIPELGRSPGEGNGNPLQYSCLENSMERGAWRVIVHAVAKTQTQLSDYHTHTHSLKCVSAQGFTFSDVGTVFAQGPKVHEREGM